MEEHIWESSRNSSSSPSTLGRVMNMLLSSRPKQLQSALSRVGSGLQRSSGVPLDESVSYIQRYVTDAIENKEPLDQVLIPMIENSLKAYGSKQCKQVLMLLNWLFQDERLLQALLTNLAEIIMRKDDNYIALGWCTLIRVLVDHEIATNQLPAAGKQEMQKTLLTILLRSGSQLSSIMCKGSIVKDGFELPNRLAMAAADCSLALTEALTQRAPVSDVLSTQIRSSDSNAVHITCSKKESSIGSRSPRDLEHMEMQFLLWDHLDELLVLVQKLQAWSRKSRPLHANGLEQVSNWLRDIRGYYGSVEDEADGNMLKAGVLLLSSCWKHYAMLLRLEDQRFPKCYREILDQYLSAFQLYAQDNADENPGKKNSGVETKKFFLNCICLLLGRLNKKQLEIAMSESGQQISNLMLSQLQCSDEEVIDQAVNILRAIIFRTTLSPSGSSSLDSRQMEAALPLFLSILDERDSTARAVVMLISEYCYLYPDGCLQEIFKRLDCGNHCQRRNAIDVIAELIHICSNSRNTLPPPVQQDVANHLLQRLGDQDPVVRARASNLFPQIDPSLVLPALVDHMYSPEEKVQSSASDSVVAVLKSHSQNFDVIVMLLDCLSNLSQSAGLPKISAESVPLDAMTVQSGTKLDVERVLRLIPKWSESVQDWSILIEPLIKKMIGDPTNAVIVRFLSYISEQLAEAKDVVLHQVLLHMQRQKEMDKDWFHQSGGEITTSDGSARLRDSLFDHLCPLLIIRLLPLRIFDDLNSSVVYGRLLNRDVLNGNSDFIVNNQDCIAGQLIKRAFLLFEFEDVRKLAVELCGRLHPQVLVPVVGSLLDDAKGTRDTLKLKACLFAVCTSLVVRGKETARHPVMVKIRQILEAVLLWPSLDGDGVSKAQHGCIDCLALIICAQLQALEPSKSCTWDKTSTVEGDATIESPILTYVIQRLTCVHCNKSDENALYKDTESNDKSPNTLLILSEHPSVAPIPLSFRLCMANVLINACQKISTSAKHLFASRTLPALIHSIEVITEKEVRAACLQVLFSAVYHLKSVVLPYSSDLLKLSMKALRKGSDKEKVAGAKLMASLMASEDAIVENISGGLLEAKSLLASISSKTSSSELRQLCQKLLVCITPPLENILRSL